MEAWGVRAICLHVQKGFASLAVAPASADQDPCAGGNAAVFLFPGFDTVNGEQEVGGLLDIGGNVDNAGRADKFSWRDSIGGVVGQVFAGDPVDGGIEVGAGMLAQRDDVPVPRRATIIVVGDFDHG